MGVISEHIQRKLEEDIRSKGLLVWLDKEDEFSPLVDEWVALYKGGKFAYPVFAFRGSFLELMMESRAILAQKDMPKCVIHMPGFNEQEIKDTPFYEAYKAGQRWRISLATMIRESAQGRLSPDGIESLLLKEKLDLASAEEYLSSIQEIPPEMKRLVTRYGEDGLLLRFIEDAASIDHDLASDPKDCFPLLRDHFLKLLGLDDQWLNDWNKHGADYARPEEQAELLVSYLLCLEYAGDLTVNPPSERLIRLRNKPKEYQARAVRLLKELRCNGAEVYVKWADLIEADLTEAETGLKPADLGKVDSFRFEADIFAREALRLLVAEKWEEALRLAQARLPGQRGESISHTFWLTRDVQRQWLWEWIDAAAKLGAGIVGAKSGPAPAVAHATIGDLGLAYAQTGWELDRLHRRFAVLTERYNSGNKPLYFQSFVGIRKALNRLYRDSIDAQSRKWNETCERTGFLGHDGKPPAQLPA